MEDQHSNQSSKLNERKVVTKRKYTEAYPAKTVGSAARIRNKMLEAIASGRITQQDFDKMLSELSSDSKRWLNRNGQLFNISEDGISLSSFGKRILKGITVNEATTKNPEVWVPGDFDKAVSKLSADKIDLDTIKKLAKKYKVFLDDAISYVEYGWSLDLQENKKIHMESKYVNESFLDFTRKLNETTEIVSIDEAFKSSKLRNLVRMDQAQRDGYGKAKNLAAGIYGLSKLKLDTIEDSSLIDVDPKEAYKKYQNNRDYLVFYIVDNDKENEFSKSGYTSMLKPGILALTRGKDFLSVQYSRSRDRSLDQTLGKDDGNAIGGNKRYSGYDASGIASVVRASKLADRAIVIDIVNGGETSSKQRNERARAKEGALAFKNDSDFKKANQARYKEILATKASKLPLDKMVNDAIDLLGNHIKDGLKANKKTEYGELKIGENSRGRAVKITDASNHMGRILSDYQRYVEYMVKAEEEKGRDYSSGYYEKNSKQYAKDIKDAVKKIPTFDYAW
jgi:hypothetical protein